MIKLLCVKNNETFNITQLVQSVTWSGDVKACSRKLEFSIISSANDNNIPKFDIPLSSLIIFYENDKELFRGFVFEREKSSNNTSMTFLCYDYAERLNKIKASYNIKNKTASEIFKMLCNDYSLKTDKIASSNAKIKKVFIGNTLYEIMQSAYTEQSKKDGKKYMIYADKDAINTMQKGIVTLETRFEEGKNIIGTNFKESISNIMYC